MMRNTFLAFRLVLIALFSKLGLFLLALAIWNIRATISSDLQASSTSSIFIVFLSCLDFFGVVFALADIFRPKARTSRISLECTWVGILTLFHIGTAIKAILNGPELACSKSPNWSVCASTSLLVPTSWLSAMLFLTYLTALIVATMVHKPIYPHIWETPIYSIQWFENSRERPSREQVVRDFCSPTAPPRDRQDSDATLFHDDIETLPKIKTQNSSRRGSVVSQAISWIVPQVHRGVDPLSLQVPIEMTRRTSSMSPFSQPSLPSFPDRTAGPVAPNNSRYNVLTRAEGQPQDSTRHRTNSLQLSEIDLDQSVRIPHLTQWIKSQEELKLKKARQAPASSHHR